MDWHQVDPNNLVPGQGAGLACHAPDLCERRRVRVTPPGFIPINVHVDSDSWRGHPVVEWTVKVPDRNDGHPTTVLGIYDGGGVTSRDVITFIIAHEVCEALHVGGVRAWDPHRGEDEDVAETPREIVERACAGRGLPRASLIHPAIPTEIITGDAGYHVRAVGSGYRPVAFVRSAFDLPAIVMAIWADRLRQLAGPSWWTR